MDQAARDGIVLAFLRAQPRYARLGSLVLGVIEGDVTLPRGTVYALKHRLKAEDRLIEKIELHAAQLKTQVGPDDYADVVDDLLGIRVICLLPSAVALVDGLIRSLVAERRLEFVHEPQLKRTFDIPVNPKERTESAVDLQYTGYASNHYVIRAGPNSGFPPDLIGLKAEIQVRTIFEEAWGEVDHARYEMARSGTVSVPQSIERGFYTLGAHLAVIGVQAEFLTQELRSLSTQRAGTPAPEIGESLGTVLGFALAERAERHVVRRFLDFVEATSRAPAPAELARLISDDVRSRFVTVYRRVMESEPFASSDTRDDDAITLVDFAISRETEPQLAERRLTSVLRTRRRRATGGTVPTLPT